MYGLGFQNKNQYSYYNVTGKNSNYVDQNNQQQPIYYPQDGQRARASLSQYDPQQKRPNIKFVGSVPKYYEPQEQQGLQGQQSQPNKKIIIISQNKKEDLYAEEQIKQQVYQQINNTQPRSISQQPIISNNPKIRIINQQQNYIKPASPPQFIIKEHKNEEYFNQSRISQKSTRPLSRAGIQKNAILQKQQELASVLQKTGQSIFQTVLKTQVSYRCQVCDYGISENMIMLSCQHCYHEHCFIQFIQGQNGTKFFCYCKQKINIGSWSQNENLKNFIDKILKNQLQDIRRKYQEKFQDCKRCSFFWVKNKSSLAYCPLCLMSAQLK